MNILQEYRFVLILASIFLGGLVILMFTIMEVQNFTQYETDFIVKHEQLRDVEWKTLRDVLVSPDGGINGLKNSSLFWNAVKSDTIYLLDDYNTNKLEDLVIDVPDSGDQGIYYFTTSSFSDGTDNTIDLKSIDSLSSWSWYIDSWMDVPTNGWVIYVFKDRDSAIDAIEKYIPEGNLVTLNTIDGPQEIWVQRVFQEDTAARVSASASDSEAPVVSLIGNASVTSDINQPYIDQGVTATDNIDSLADLDIDIDDSNVDIANAGSYTVDITVTDTSNNSASLTRNVIINPAPDSVAPIISLMGAGISLEVGDTYLEPWYTASDDTDGDITGSVIVSGTIDNTTPGTNTLTYTVTDAATNSTSITRTILVQDTTSPIITLVWGSISIEANTSYIEQGYSANDWVDGDITSSVVTSGSVNTAVPGIYTLTYSVSDSSSNSTSITRMVTVQDTNAPIITLVWGAVFLETNASYAEPGYSASDTIDGNLTSSVVVSGFINVNVPGVYTLTYTVSDSSSNTDTQTRTVTVEDNTAPVLTLVWGNTNITVNTPYSEPGYSATDNIDGNLTSSVNVSGSVNSSIPGSYTLTYSVTDNSGNTTQKQRVILVQDTIAPNLTLVWGNISIDVNTSYSEPGYNANDNVDGNISGNVNVSGTVNTSTPGLYTLTYSVTDSNWNTSTQTRTVLVQDNTIPVITLIGGNITINQGDTYSEPGYNATDNVDGNISGNVNVTGSVNSSTPGTYTLNYNVSDSSNNNATQRQRIVTVSPDYTYCYELAAYNGGYEITNYKGYANSVTPSNSLRRQFSFNVSSNIPNYDPTCNASLPGGNLVIPDSINGLNILKIGDNAFEKRHLTNVTLPSNLQVVGQSAFRRNLIQPSITLPDSLTTVDALGFESNYISTINFWTGLNNVGISAFALNEIVTLSLPSGVSSYGVAAFQRNSIENLTFPSDLTNLSGNMFAYNNIQTLVIPSTIQNIDYQAFNYNNISSLTVQNPSINLWNLTFWKNSSMVNVYIPTGMSWPTSDNAFNEAQPAVEQAHTFYFY